MVDSRTQFSPSLYILAQSITLLALVVRPSSYRWIAFIPIALIYYFLVFHTTTGDVTGDLGIGSAALTQLLYAADYILFTDVQRELKLKTQKDAPISEAPVTSRLKWGVLLLANARGIGWKHEPTSNLPKRPFNQSRFKFVYLTLLCALFHVVMNVVSRTHVVTNPALMGPPGTSLGQFGLYWRATGMLAFAAAAVAHISLLHCAASIAAVVMGISDPEDWPNLYGSVREAYTIQRFWGRTWHQLIRRALCTCNDFIVYKVFRLPPKTTFTSYVRLYTIFILSAWVHYGGEYMMLGRRGTSAPMFFFLQAVGITLERGVQTVTRHFRLKIPGWIQKTVGYIWVFCWFVWTVPYFVDPMIDSASFVHNKGLDLDQVIHSLRGRFL